MARPIHADAEATRKRILHAASGLFSEKGAASTSMREIAKHAEVSMATVHHYYGGKAELYLACVEAMYGEMRTLREELRGAFETTSDLDQIIDIGVRRGCRFARRHRPAVQLMTRIVLDTGGLEAAKREEFLLPFLDQGAALLSPLFPRSARHLRLTLLSINYLITRFTLNSERETALVVGLAEESTDEAQLAVEDYLIAATRDLLGMPHRKSKNDEGEGD